MIEFEGIGTHWWIELDQSKHVEVEPLVLHAVSQFESRYSRFRSDSFISRLNKEKKLVIDSAELYEILAFGISMYEKTQGYFSPLVGTYLNQFGYDDHYSFEEKNGIEEEPQIIQFDSNTLILSETAYFDIGGYGKGWLIDSISQVLVLHGVDRFVINAGGDIICKGYFDYPQTFYLEHPSLNKTHIGEINMTHGSLASSSINRRAWKTNKGFRNHIINPLTHMPSQEIIASYVYADSALIADTLATILLINPTLDFQAIFDNSSIEYCIVNKDLKIHKTKGYSATMYN
jgi:thiamine biosynthesis lipoprotein